MTDQTILVVDDDSKIRTLLRNVLEGDGFAVVEASSAAETMQALTAQTLSLISLDLQLGSDDGVELAREIRRVSRVPIIMVTGKEDVIDRVVGLEVGADDYITKPFHVREVIARIRSVLRRTTSPLAAPEIREVPSPEGLRFRFDGMLAHPNHLQLVDRDGQDCGLTSGDFKLLLVFLERPRHVLSRDQLMDLTGGLEWTPLDRTIDNQVARLRKKIERDPARPQVIKTVRGIGYTLGCDVQVLQPSDTAAKSA